MKFLSKPDDSSRFQGCGLLGFLCQARRFEEACGKGNQKGAELRRLLAGRSQAEPNGFEEETEGKESTKWHKIGIGSMFGAVNSWCGGPWSGR